MIPVFNDETGIFQQRLDIFNTTASDGFVTDDNGGNRVMTFSMTLPIFSQNKFIHNMVRESKKISKNCLWFSTLVSKQSNLKGIYKSLERIEAIQVKTIPMGTGNKSTRIVAWTFLSKKEQNEWAKKRWRGTRPA